MAVTVTTKTSWFSRIGSSIKGILFGVLLVIASFPLLFWNEGRAVKQHKSLTEGAAAVISVSSDSVDSANEGALVHISGEATTDAILTDEEFNVSENAIKLRRTVEMYQWIEDEDSETRTTLGGGEETVTTYTYQKGWSSSVIDSSDFQESGHDNPGSMAYESKSYVAGKVTVGAFTLSSSQVGSINNYSKYTVTEENLDGVDDWDVQLSNGSYYVGDSATNPEIGDLKVTIEVVKPTVVSVVAEQVGNSFAPYATDAGGTIGLLQTGEVSAEDMFESAIQGNKVVTWLLRVGGFFLMFLGFSTIFKPLSVLGDVVPFIGNLVGMATGLLSAVIAFGLSLITIAIAWVFYRPVLGISLLVIAVVVVVFGVNMVKKKQKR